MFYKYRIIPWVSAVAGTEFQWNYQNNWIHVKIWLVNPNILCIQLDWDCYNLTTNNQYQFVIVQNLIQLKYSYRIKFSI